MVLECFVLGTDAKFVEQGGESYRIRFLLRAIFLVLPSSLAHVVYCRIR